MNQQKTKAEALEHYEGLAREAQALHPVFVGLLNDFADRELAKAKQVRLEDGESEE